MTNLARMCYQASRGLYGAQACNTGPQWGPEHAGEEGKDDGFGETEYDAINSDWTRSIPI